jgi:hypothetical protein
MFEMLLDGLMHMAEGECRIGPSIQAGEFDYVLNARRFASVDERALRFDHVHSGGRDHEDSIDAV